MLSIKNLVEHFIDDVRKSDEELEVSFWNYLSNNMTGEAEVEYYHLLGSYALKVCEELEEEETQEAEEVSQALREYAEKWEAMTVRDLH